MDGMLQLRCAEVALARSSQPGYGPCGPCDAPELPGGAANTLAAATLRALLLSWGLDAACAGSPAWNPFAVFVRPGSRVVLKPNWVFHRNRSGETFECMVTHPSVIDAVLEYLALARPGPVVIGDAPVQGCDFEALRSACELDALADGWRSRGLDLAIADFRRTVLPGARMGAHRIENRRGLDGYILFDLGAGSLLEPVSREGVFRVTMYDPRCLANTHGPGRHEYLVAREVIEAETVINLPKLKTHKKACLTGALKNLIGINGNKEFLPHHRKGSVAAGGDCYRDNSLPKRTAEDLLDAANRRSGAAQKLLAGSAGAVLACVRRLGQDDDVEGSWYGNDTIWRTCLDLNRILLYGRPDGNLAPVPQRQVISITDALIAGEGEGPLAPTPVAAGFLTGAQNAAAAEWVHAGLMGFDPRRIPLVREAFANFEYPLAAFTPGEIRVRMGGQVLEAGALEPFGRRFRPPSGWSGHCEAQVLGA